MVKVLLNILDKIIQKFKYARVRNAIKKEKHFGDRRKIKIKKQKPKKDKLKNVKYFEKYISGNDKNKDIEKNHKKSEKAKPLDLKVHKNIDKKEDNEDIEEFEIREKPDSKSEKIGTIRKGDKYKKLKSVPFWLEISFNGKKGYLSKIAANKMK